MAEPLFLDVFQAMLTVELGLPADPFPLLIRWEAALMALRRLNPAHPEIAALKDVHHAQLGRLQRGLHTAARGAPPFDRFTVEQRRAARGFLDRVLGNLLQWRPNAPSSVTLLFGELIKGCTYFANQAPAARADPIPMYHRLFSCGPKVPPHFVEDNLFCEFALTTEQLDHRRPRMERCYIERQIYDTIFKHENLCTSYSPSASSNTATTSRANTAPSGRPSTSTFAGPDVEPPDQDDGHMFQIDLAKRGYITCFPGRDIEVAVSYTEKFPTKVIVTRKYNGRTTSVETYEKLFEFTASGQKRYVDPVLCTRRVFQGRNVVEFAKLQTFDAELEWRRTGGANVGANVNVNTLNTAATSVTRTHNGV